MEGVSNLFHLGCTRFAFPRSVALQLALIDSSNPFQGRIRKNTPVMLQPGLRYQIYIPIQNQPSKTDEISSLNSRPCIQMKFNGFLNIFFQLLKCFPGRYTSGKLVKISGNNYFLTTQLILILFPYLQILICFHDQDYKRPDCFKILFEVLGNKSSLNLPGTVTVPCLTGCLNCLWLPFCLKKYQPSLVM